jgi:hypothetical protein
MSERLIHLIARFLLISEAEVWDSLESRRTFSATEIAALGKFLRRLKKAGSEAELAKVIRRTENQLLPPEIETSFIGTFDIVAGRASLTDEEFKVVRDSHLYPRKRTAGEIGNFLAELRDRFGQDPEFDYWQVRIGRTESAAAVIFDKGKADLLDEKNRIQALRNQLYWTRLADVAPERVRWYAVERRTQHPLSVRIEWREAWPGLRHPSDFGNPFLFRRFSENWIDWKISSLRTIAAQLSPKQWTARTVIFHSDHMTVSADSRSEGQTEVLAIKGKFSTRQMYPNGRKRDQAMRIGFSWHVPRDPVQGILIPDAVKILRSLAVWSCGEDARTMRYFDTEVLHRLETSLH